MLIHNVFGWLNNLLEHDERDEEDGQGLVEYALILVMVAAVVLAIAAVLGPGIGNIYSNLVATL
jgi:pilus assembly protein Flp/PilA